MITVKRNQLKLIVIVIGLLVIPVSESIANGGDSGGLTVPKQDQEAEINLTADSGEYTHTLTGSLSDGGAWSLQIGTYREPEHDSEEDVHFLITVEDPVYGVGDEVHIFFDVNHNHLIFGDILDRQVVIKRGPSGGVKVGKANPGGPPDDASDLPGPEWDIDDDGSTWKAELRIKASDLSLNFIPSISGMLIMFRDQDSSTIQSPSFYPAGATLLNAESWENLKTRYPLDYVLLIDQSGSMNNEIDDSTTRWQSAKIASDIFVQLMYAIRSPYFDDKIGLRTYYWEEECIDGEYYYIINENGYMEPVWICFHSVTGDYVSEEEPMGSLDDISIDGYTDSFSPPLSNPVRDWRTPIKRGLDSAFTTLDGGESEKVILLLSDGFHNMPSRNYDEEPYEFFENPSNPRPSDFQVNTVALGPDESVGTELLENIKDTFRGFGGSYTSAVEEKELISAFVENTFPYFYLNRVEVSSSGQFDVNANESRLVVMLVWYSTNATERHFRLKKVDDDIIDNTDPGYHHYKHPTLPYEIAYYVIDDPSPAGFWQTIKPDSDDAEVGDSAFAIFDPTVYAYFSVVQDEEDFILKAVLKENGQAISESGAEVLVDVNRPVEGLGTYTSTAQPDCSFARPHFSGKKTNSIQILGGKVAKEKVASTSYDKTRQGPIPKHIAKVKELFRICGKDRLDRESETSLRLYDDATHGDSLAGDGIFTYRYTDTQYEGSYTFKFTASGTALSGTTFSRIKTLSAHKSVKVNSGNTEFDFVHRDYTRFLRYIEVYAILRDRFKEYLGPGHKVQFETNAGKLTGQVKDHNNGIYSQILEYDDSKDKPIVSVLVDGQELERINIFKAIELVPFAGYTYFDNSLNLDDGVVVGARFGYRMTNRLTFELEGGATFTDSSAGDSGHVIQALLNARYDVYSVNTRLGQLTPYVTVGAGGVFFRGFGDDDEAFALQGGVGATLDISSTIGIRVDGRLLRFNDVWNAGTTTNYQVTGGVVFRF